MSGPFKAALVLFVLQQFVSPIVAWGAIASLSAGNLSSGWSIAGLVVNIILFVVVAILMVAGAVLNSSISTETRVGSSVLAILASGAAIAGPFVSLVGWQLALTLGSLTFWFLAWAIGNGYRGIGWVGLALGPLGAIIATFLYADFVLWTLAGGSYSLPSQVFLVFVAAAMLALVVLLAFGATARWDRNRQAGPGTAVTVVVLVVALAVVIPNLVAGDNALAGGLAGVSSASPLIGGGFSSSFGSGTASGNSDPGIANGQDGSTGGGTGGSTGTTGSVGSTPEVTAADVENSTVTATSTLPPSASYSYGPLNVIDGQPGTAWCEGVAGDGLGESVTFTFAQPVVVSGFTIDNGYWRTFDRLEYNNRVKSMYIRFDTGAADLVNLPDPYEQGALPATGESFSFPAPRVTSSLTFEITSIYHEIDTQASDTCISEIGLF